MQGKYPVITLCGSTRFEEQFMEAQKKLTLEGNIVISVGLFGHSGDSEVWENMDEGTLTKTKEMHDDMHKRKIGKKCLRICYEKNKTEIRIGEKQAKIDMYPESWTHIKSVYGAGLFFILR